MAYGRRAELQTELKGKSKSKAAESKDDFVHRLQVALKELRESNYWLRLLAQAGKLPKPPRAASG
jgi:four helix bundle protein